MRKVIQKNATIEGDGKAYPFTVVADLKDAGVICKSANGQTVIVQHDEIESVTTYCMKSVVVETAEAPKHGEKVKEVK